MNINGQQLKHLREQKLLTQDQLAIMSGLNIRTIQRVEKTGVASKETIKALCASLEVKAETLQSSSTATLSPTATSWRMYMLSATIIGIVIIWSSFKTKEAPLKPGTMLIGSDSTYIDANGNYVMQGDVKVSFPDNDLKELQSDSLYEQGGQIVTGAETQIMINDQMHQLDKSILVLQNNTRHLYTERFEISSENNANQTTSIAD